jgi:hypothetical protein
MPSPAHESAVAELREHPDLLLKLVRKLLNAKLDPHLKPIDATQRFANPEEVRPDLVFVGRRRRWVAVEVQNTIDRTKRRRWLLAASMLFNDHGTMGEVVVITASRRVARWAEKVASARCALGTALTLRPVVLLLDSAAVDALLDPQQPELAFFAVWAIRRRHGEGAKQTVERALELTTALPAPLREKQGCAIVNVLNREMAAFAREVMMETSKQTGTKWGRALLAELKAMGIAEGEAKGEAKGKAEGEAKGKREALLTVLSARELPVSSAQQRRIQKCTDLELLDTWIRRAATATSVEEAMESPPRSPRKAAAKQARPATRRRATRG